MDWDEKGAELAPAHVNADSSDAEVWINLRRLTKIAGA